MIFVTNFNDRTIPNNTEIINTTSRSNNWTKEFSPFFLGPIKLYNEYEALNMENAWQFSKVYNEHADENNNPNDRYFEWAQNGWNQKWAYRYPMGKGAKPLFSYWDGEKLDYIAARKKIYIPLYAEAVQKTQAFKKLKEIFETGKDIYLQDFDGYNHKKLNMTYNDVIHDPIRKMGHAFVIAMLIEQEVL